MSDSVIAAHPPNDGREWDCQCARCGSSVIDEWCPDCGGDCEVWEDGESFSCSTCDGAGCWRVCASEDGWCEAHPIPGREQIRRGAIEWFVTGGDDE